MSLLYDLEATQSVRGQTHGGAQYAKTLFARLLGGTGPDEIVGHYDPRRPLDADVLEAANGAGVQLAETTSTASLGRLAKAHGCTSYASALPYALHGADLSGLDVVLALHGLRHYECPVDRHGWRYARSPSDLAKWAAKMAAPGLFAERQRRRLEGVLTVPARRLTVVVPSLHTRFAIRDAFPRLRDLDLRVLYCPETEVSRVAPSGDDVLSELGLEPGGYVLMVSGGKWIKNVYRALAAAVDVIESSPGGAGIRIALAGGAPAHLPSRWRRHIVELGRVPTADLAAVYGNASCLMYPTLNEGFGYPPLEAMVRGTPVLCAAVTSTTELFGDAVLWFDPRSVAEMRNRLRLILEDADLRETYAARGRARHAAVADRQRRDLDHLCALVAGAPGAP